MAAEVGASTLEKLRFQPATSRSFVRIAGLIILFSAAPVWEATRLTGLANTDVWWHLRTGLWILKQHTLPHTGLFSQHSALPWHDFGWLYQIMLAATYKVFGLRAIVMALMALRMLFAVLTYRLARIAGSPFSIAVLLSAVAQYVIPGLQPTPSSLSVLFFGMELLLILQSRRSGSWRLLWWLAPLFVLWANLDVEAVTGVGLLLIFLLALAMEEGSRRAGMTFVDRTNGLLPLKRVGLIVGSSAVCTMLNPYTFHIFADFARGLYSSVGFEYFAEMRAMSFRRPQEYLLMFLVMTAFLVLGRRRWLQILEMLLLIASTVLAFRIQREAWVAVLVAVAIIGTAFPAEEPSRKSDKRWKWQMALAATLAGTVFLMAALLLPSAPALMNNIGRSYPVQACDFIAKNRLPQPLFNVYSWGGFVTWYLPEYPVAIDSRVDLYGDEILDQYFQLISGKGRLDADPSFASAQTLLLERQSGMANALSKIPALSSRYRMVYSDDLAVVFVKQ